MVKIVRVRLFSQLFERVGCVHVLPFSLEVDITNKDEMMKIVKSTLGTKFIKKW